MRKRRGSSSSSLDLALKQLDPLNPLPTTSFLWSKATDYPWSDLLQTAETVSRMCLLCGDSAATGLGPFLRRYILKFLTQDLWISSKLPSIHCHQLCVKFSHGLRTKSRSSLPKGKCERRGRERFFFINFFCFKMSRSYER